MPPPFFKTVIGVPPQHDIHGILHTDTEALTQCQFDCIQRLSLEHKLQQEQYFLSHPEIRSMLELCTSKMIQETERNRDKPILEAMSLYFARPIQDIDKEIREYHHAQRRYDDKPDFKADKRIMEDYTLKNDLIGIIEKHYPPKSIYKATPDSDTTLTESSTFISLLTSESTLATPEPTPPPELTMSDVIFEMVSNTLNKATLLHVTDYDIKYDTAYVELMKVVEIAMEIPVQELREELTELCNMAYVHFEYLILSKERYDAEIAWEKRMRKKLKRLLRRQHNFKGYETPSTPRSVLSSHPSYKLPAPRPCVCAPQWTYNRYPKDRCGIYLPSGKEFSNHNITLTPTVSHDAGPEPDSVPTKSTPEIKSTIKGVAFKNESNEELQASTSF